MLATLNPIEMEGTYQLPEAQLDRFLFKVRLDYPSQDELERILGADHRRRAADRAPGARRRATPPRASRSSSSWCARCSSRRTSSATSPALVRADAAGTADGDPDVRRWVAYGASPRGGQALLLGAKVHALLDGRPHVALEDVDRVARAALRHRLVLSFAAETEGVEPRRGGRTRARRRGPPAR